MLKLKLLLVASIFPILLLQACSSNGFHLRKELDLPTTYQNIQIENLSYENGFVKAFELALEESGGILRKKADTKIKIINFREGKHTIAYTNKRKAREFLLSLKFDYLILSTEHKVIKQKHRIHIDRVFIYDADFALGKAEEESKIKQSLYQEAARLILLKLHYARE